MRRKMQLFARPEKCDGLGARGSLDGSVRLDADRPAAEAWRAKKPSAARRLAKARPANPPPISQRSSRRVQPQGKMRGRRTLPNELFLETGSVDIDELVGVEEDVAQTLERSRGR
jgi:hypothetical protein